MAKKKDAAAAHWFSADGPAAVRPLPTTIQSLFLPNLVADAADNPQINAYADRRDQAHAVVLDWIDRLRSGVLLNLSESQVEQDFTSGLLSALGYRSFVQGPAAEVDAAAAGPSAWSMQPKWHFPGTGYVDVALGRFQADDQGQPIGQILAVCELKGARVDLDRRDPKTGRSPVRQAWDYLVATETARWAIVSNFVEFRLYHRNKGIGHVHRVELAELADPAAFAGFFAVFHADSLLKETALSLHAAELLRRTTERQEEVGDQLYRLYDDRRTELIRILLGRPGTDLETAIRSAQKLLDRILFIAFAEDRKLLDDPRLLETIHRQKAPKRTAWRNFQALFRSFDRGDRRLGVPPFDGGLFRPDPILDARDFRLGDSWPQLFETIGGFNFRDEVSVEVLGRIFELSLRDLDRIRDQGLDAYEAARADDRGRTAPDRRKKEGAFYTSKPIVRHLIASAIDPVWESTRRTVAQKHGLDPASPGSPPPAGYLRDLLASFDALTVCDPACGSGAFLIAAFEWFETHRMALLDDLAEAEPDAPECRGAREDWRHRSARSILRRNLYGVDRAAEAVEIARLSLWIRTARRGQRLTRLDSNVVEGNSLVDDAAVDPGRAFSWRKRFARVFARGGFDAVVGNPPYVRQEWLGSAMKTYLASKFRSYHGMADLYVYFYERGLDVLKPGGRLAFVVTNKWMKAGYGEPLRQLFAESAWVEQVIDFGHAKQFFPEADVFPSFLVVRKPRPDEADDEGTARVCAIPRDLVNLEELPALIETHAIQVERDRFTADAWNLEPRAVNDLMAKIRANGVPLTEFAGVKPYRGILTGFNEAFLIDSSTRDALFRRDPRSDELVRPYLRGQDVKRWSPEWAGLWMIAMKSSSDHPWPWADLGDEAEAMFAREYPGLHQHFRRFERRLKERQDHGRYWWELRPCAYWDAFTPPKITYQEITWRLNFCLDVNGTLINNTAYILCVDDRWILSVLNSSAGWWYAWRAAQHGKDEALRYIASFMDNFPIPPRPKSRTHEKIANRLIGLAREDHAAIANLLGWLRIEYDAASPSRKLQEPVGLNYEDFVDEVKKARGKSKLSSPAMIALREEYDRTIEPARRRLVEAAALERRLNDLVNAAYGLTADDVALMWATAPPRMPIARPGG